jgi:iron complex outermembrane receptor protein
LVTERDRFDFNLAYLHAQYTDFVLPCGDQFGLPPPAGYVPPPGCAAGPALRLPVDYTGNALARSPRWSATLGYQHDWQFGSGARFGARLQSHYESSKNLDYHNFALTEQGAFTKTDFSLIYTSADKRWNAMAYVRNVEDDDVLVFAQPRSNAPVSRTAGTARFAMPRTYGVQLTASF